MTNFEIELAEAFAVDTNKSMYLTGKAGTGKTTLLRKIAADATKNMVIVAPTGVAAINAGGVTIHSMFGLPLTAFIPTGDYTDPNLITNRRVLLSHIKFRKEKVKLLRQMETLVIDEVSMVRADILDAVDFVLRTIRRNDAPMGGVQVILIGDVYQLPPVVKDNEWATLKNYYEGPYFFNAHVWPLLQAAEIELKQIYRQSDEKFVRLLNNIRNMELNEDDYELLQSRYKPTFNPNGEGYILLSTHNAKADHVNKTKLDELPGYTHLFEAEITGDFPEHAYPCDKVLLLKEGAQVMFIRNDAETGKYFNGKLATVKLIDHEGVVVTFQDNKEDYRLKKEVWENINYTVDDTTGKINKNELGSFSQYPLRLAWAVTIHKSQGLTFDKVIVDAGRSFAAGQVYVALSRCRTLQGLVLHSMISPQALHSDHRIFRFAENHHTAAELEHVLEAEKMEYARYRLRRLFNFDDLAEHVEEWLGWLAEKDIPEKENVYQLINRTKDASAHMRDVSSKFSAQLNRILEEVYRKTQPTDVLVERCEKAITYFTDYLFTELIEPTHAHLQAVAFKAKLKTYTRFIQSVNNRYWALLNQLYSAKFGDVILFPHPPKHKPEQLAMVEAIGVDSKIKKGDTYQETLLLHKQGLKAADIAAKRGLTTGTIKSHFAKLVTSGHLSATEVLDDAAIEALTEYLNAHRTPTIATFKEQFGEQFDYNELRIVQQHLTQKRKS